MIQLDGFPEGSIRTDPFFHNQFPEEIQKLDLPCQLPIKDALNK